MYVCVCVCSLPKDTPRSKSRIFLDGYCSTAQGLLDWFEIDLGFTKFLFIQTDLCILCVFVLCLLISRDLHLYIT